MSNGEILTRYIVYSLILGVLVIQGLGHLGYVWVFVDDVDHGTARLEVNETMVHVPTWAIPTYEEGDVIVGNIDRRELTVRQLQDHLIKR